MMYITTVLLVCVTAGSLTLDCNSSILYFNTDFCFENLQTKRKEKVIDFPGE